MNLYTRIWLKLAPKGWRAVSTNYLSTKREELKRLRLKNAALYGIVKELQQGYDQLASIISTTTEEVSQNAGETFACT